MTYIILSISFFIMGGVYWYNQGFHNGKKEILQKYLLAEKQNSKLWNKNLELMNILQRYDKSVLSCIHYNGENN